MKLKIPGGIVASMLLLTTSAAAEDAVILTVDGKTRDGLVHTFTLADLQRLTQDTIRTGTPWTDGQSDYHGVVLAELMEAVGAEGTSAWVAAINDYAADVPLSDFAEYGVVLAYSRDGELLEVQDKGPLFVIYPFDDQPELRSEMYFSRAVWQVSRITIE